MPENRTDQEALAAVCQMPVEYHRRGDVSILRLAEESDYRAHRTAIGVEHIQRYLESHPELVGEWYVYSDNKRTSTGWYFDHAGRRVGYFSGSRREHERTFDDATQACAAFIKHEMDSILGHAA
jgi:hypothetical protein